MATAAENHTPTRYAIGQVDRSAAIHELIISVGPRPGDGLVKQASLF